MLSCSSCSQQVSCVCLPCGVEYCGPCDRKSPSHVTHRKQLISGVLSRCSKIRVTMPNTEQFENTKRDLVDAVEKNLAILKNLQSLQAQFEGCLAEGEYHCELRRLSKRFTEEKDEETRREILQKIITKSQKCGFELDDITQPEHKKLDKINQQLAEQGQLTRSLQEDIRRLQDSIQGASALFEVNGRNVIGINKSTTVRNESNQYTLRSKTTTPLAQSGRDRSVSPLPAKKLKMNQ